LHFPKGQFLPFWTAKRTRFAVSDALIDCPFGFSGTCRKSKVQGFWLILAKNLAPEQNENGFEGLIEFGFCFVNETPFIVPNQTADYKKTK